MATSSIDLGALDSAADEPVVDQTTEVDADSGAADDSADSSQQTDQQAVKIDGRKGPQAIRNAVKVASEAFPEQAGPLKEMADGYFREQAFKQVFPTPQDAASAKQLLETAGGVDGIAALQQRDAMYTTQDEFLKEGNPEVLDDFFEDFPEGAAALAPHYLEKLAKVNPDAFNQAIVPYALGMLQNVGLGAYLKTMAAEPDVKRKDALIAQLAQWFTGEQNKLANVRKPEPVNDRLKQRETALTQRENDIFTRAVNDRVTGQVEAKLGPTVEQYAKKNGWNEEQKAEFRQRLLNDVAAQMDKDEIYKKQAGLRYSARGRSHDAVASFVAGEFVRRMNDKDGALATEAKMHKLFGKTAAARPGTGVPRPAPGQTGMVKVSAEPARDQIDWNHPNAELLYIQNKAKLKSGRMVTW